MKSLHYSSHTIALVFSLTLVTFLNAASSLTAESNEKSLASLDTNVSVGPFPYDLTAEAVQNVDYLISNSANVYTVQLDNGVPWDEALSGATFQAELLDQWRRHKNSIRPYQKVYLAIAPLAEDRISWATGYNGQKAPTWASDESQASANLKDAYVKYVLRAIEYFRPQFLNIGVEAGDMAAKRPSKWPLFEELYASTTSAIRAKYPNIKIGISFGLPLLQIDGALDRAMKLIELSDYVGISFYPYMSDFYVMLGAKPLPAPPDEWRKPLEWIHQKVNKPIAICETAYSSEPVSVPSFKLNLQGSSALQSEYIEDLATIARRDKYLFTAFFLAVDYDALMKKMHPGNDVPNLWTRTGFYDKDLKEKPAWQSYRKSWLKQTTQFKLPHSNSVNAAEHSDPVADSSKMLNFVTLVPDTIETIKGNEGTSFLRWNLTYRQGQFAWASSQTNEEAVKGSKGLVFKVRSDRAGPLLLQIEESGGESLFYIVKPNSDWRQLQITWKDFRPAADKRQNGTVEPEKIVRVMIADAAALDERASGKRSVDIEDMHFWKE